MHIAKTIIEARAMIKGWKQEGLTIGLVPTMGQLHIGHISLVEQAAKENDRVIVSIFVNPTQFDSKEDLDSYPSDFERDALKCEKAGTDLIFCPSADEMYPDALLTFIEVMSLTEGLCGKSRGGHFNGMCTIVAKLFNVLLPDRAYFGEKDAQQLAVVKKMVHDLNMNIGIVPCRIIREADGLACSSRNLKLSARERKAALVLYKSLTAARSLLDAGERSAKVIIAELCEVISLEPLATIDYVDIVDALTLKPVDEIREDVLVALAVFIGSTRLIDNFTCQIPTDR